MNLLSPMRTSLVALVVLLGVGTPLFAQSTDQAPSVKLPGSVAYSEPQGDAISFEENAPATGWKDAHQTLAWYGDLRQQGPLHLVLSLHLPPGEVVTLRPELSGWKTASARPTHLSLPPVTIHGAAGIVTADLGTVTIPYPGYWRFGLTGSKKSGATFGDVTELTLSGAAVKDANINRSKWRSPASVHLGYPLPEGKKIALAYTEVKATADPVYTYYCAIGFRRGYFGMQVNGPHERRIIFSIWDAGKEPTDPKKVSADDRVTLIAKGEGVVTDRFGNEGTGGHSHLIYNWKTGQPQRFIVTAEPDGTGTIYSGWFYFSERKQWGLIASFRAPRDGAYLSGLYSFNEVFGGDYGQQQRRAEFGQQWVRDTEGGWLELTRARFTHTAQNDPLVRHDWDGGAIGDHFYLENGGFLAKQATYGDIFTRTASKQGRPADIVLPARPVPPVATP